MKVVIHSMLASTRNKSHGASVNGQIVWWGELLVIKFEKVHLKFTIFTISNHVLLFLCRDKIYK